MLIDRRTLDAIHRNCLGSGEIKYNITGSLSSLLSTRLSQTRASIGFTSDYSQYKLKNFNSSVLDTAAIHGIKAALPKSEFTGICSNFSPCCME